jgi:hypothetical protein
VSLHPRNHRPGTTTATQEKTHVKPENSLTSFARTLRWAVLGATLLGLLLPALNAASAQAAEGPKWKLTVTPNADYFLPGHQGVYKIEAENVGGAPTSGEVTLKDVLPAALSAQAVDFYDMKFGTESNFSGSLCPSFVECKFPGALTGFGVSSLPPGQRLVMFVLVEATVGFEGPLEDRAEISGGGAPPAEAGAANAASANPPFGILHFGASLTDSSDNPYTQAGGHPFEFVTDFNFETYSSHHAEGEDFWKSGTSPVHDPKDITAELPPGLIANPQGIPHCPLADYFSQECEVNKVSVGDAGIKLIGYNEGAFRVIEPVFNLQPHGSYPGELGIILANLPLVIITSGVRSGSDYGVTATSVAAEYGVYRVHLNLWGVPADPSHDAMRGKVCEGVAYSGIRHLPSVAVLEEECEKEAAINGGGGPAGVPPTPFLTMPTECSGSPLNLVGRYDSWDLPGDYTERSVELPAVDGCNALSFNPTIEARPTTDLADSPSGLQFHLHVPQNEDPEGLATSELKEAVVKLPAGLTVNPSSGIGLGGCSEAEVGLHSEEPAHCPDASKLGAVKIETPLLAEALEGALYLATPHQNPSGSLLGGYIVVEGQGIKVKLAGRFELDPETGQITGRFTENPQLPFEDLELEVFGGARGALRTPAVCAGYETTALLTPYSSPESGPPAEPSDEFETSFGPGGEGSRCPNSSAAEEPNAPVFHAGTENTQAGAFSPFSLKLVREDGSQELSKIDTTLPPGLVGKLAGVGECSDAALAAAGAPGHTGKEEQAAPSCPLSSEVGTVDVSAGAGPTPLNVSGKAYLAGPYKGAPLSLAIITPAVAGPFDLGTVVVRTALNVDPFTAQIHAVSDEIPHILQGIPLDVRSVTLRMNRPNFTLNPTNCEELGFDGSATSLLGQAAPLTQRFQVGGCKALPFKPKLSLRLKGSPKRAKFPALTATLTMPPGDANVASAQVTLPHSSFLSQGHIAKTCGRPELASHTCPAASIYGHARAVTPLLDHPLEGPVYLATGFGYQLPALVADLNGQIEVLLKGKVDSGRADGIRNTFEVVPDAPVSKFTLQMFGGKKSLIENSQYLCSKHAKRKALARFTGQNGKVVELEPTVKNSCKHKKGKKGKGGSGHHKRHGG